MLPCNITVPRLPPNAGLHEWEVNLRRHHAALRLPTDRPPREQFDVRDRAWQQFRSMPALRWLMQPLA
jgi:hypothetical protein